jgi:hypothetical protein
MTSDLIAIISGVRGTFSNVVLRVAGDGGGDKHLRVDVKSIAGTSQDVKKLH